MWWLFQRFLKRTRLGYDVLVRHRWDTRGRGRTSNVGTLGCEGGLKRVARSEKNWKESNPSFPESNEVIQGVFGKRLQDDNKISEL